MLYQHKHKKGISEIVSYTLLIIIAVGISVLVFSFLKVYIPKFQTPECPPDVSIIAREISCIENKLNITLTNRGFFNISGVYIRLHPPGSRIRDTIVGDSYNDFEIPLSPGESLELEKFTSAGAGSGYTLEIQPSVLSEEGKLAACTKAIIKQNIYCSPISPPQ